MNKSIMVPTLTKELKLSITCSKYDFVCLGHKLHIRAKKLKRLVP